ncbi:MAG: hypothetical protein CL840_15365 [Crocinitomicaceae bacterium]|nr:hypothetical protein [Crocinitomicaceae bacterium]|tara:strand:- start:4053 stop:4313 length:261 start_codon:yes stop_codon:yes gene_type:complete
MQGFIMDDLRKAITGMNQMSAAINRSFKFRVLDAIKGSQGITDIDLMLRLNLPTFNHNKKSLRDVIRSLVIEGLVVRECGFLRLNK